ncbi:Diaminohydroxyphosphoribosylamino-pyrimidine deaminase [Smittium mucronatum]|uniref:Diaminohydroxyphosphoribosylamino-pyrimidine deaminase n=1 Tax=Smittium mucronatum TaxID=133383 RepID=A0A1R0GPS6_9FUNG|nr:Diaminohydroxyphosphoribosylamino-pyrimidine deaminase [Smittium mucronatum]
MYMRMALEEAKKCSPVKSAYNVGAVIVQYDKDTGTERVVSVGHSRELPGNTHAEECALKKIPESTVLGDTAIFTTMEPCSVRVSGLKSCTDRILESGIKRVYYAVKEPPHFVTCNGIEILEKNGVSVHHLFELSKECSLLNSHLD